MARIKRDPKTVALAQQIIDTYNPQSAQDMDEALKLADKICIMQGGKIQQYDTAENLLKHPANSFVKDFIGSDRLWSAPEYIKAKDNVDSINYISSDVLYSLTKLYNSKLVASLR